MPDTLNTEGLRILLLRVPGSVPVTDFEQRLRARVPTLHGPVVTWLFDEWFAMPQAAEQELRAALDGTANVERALKEFGAAEGRWVTWDGFKSLMGARDATAGRSAQPLRDRVPAGAVWIEDPEFGIEVEHGGRRVLMDWHVVTTGISAAWSLFADAATAVPWAGLRVGHIDTGYTEHPALGYTTPAGTWLRPDLGLNLYKDYKERQPTPDEPAAFHSVPEFPGPRDNLTGANGGHGTRTSSVLCGLYDTGAPDLRAPFFGAAPGAVVVPYRITDAVVIDHVPDLLARAMRHAVDDNGCSVLSISLGAVFPSRKVAQAIDHAYERGVIVCAAAGNITSEVVYPGRLNRVLTVGGVTTGDGRTVSPWSGSSRGKYVDICGPADRIRRPTTILRGDREEFRISNKGDGTSFATALAAGIATLWLAHRGAELDAQYGNERWARAAAFKRLIRQTAVVPAGWDHENFGAGLYRADALLRAPLPTLGSLHREAAAWDPFDPDV